MHCTANEYISLPEIDDKGRLLSIGCLNMQYKSLIEFRGEPVVSVSVNIDGKEAASEYQDVDHYWIPRFHLSAVGVEGTMSILTPRERKGFAYIVELRNTGGETASVKVNVRTVLEHILHTVNESKPFEGTTKCYRSSWFGTPVFDMRVGFPLLAMAMHSDCDADWELGQKNIDGVVEFSLEAGAARCVSFYWGLGFEDVSAVTAAHGLERDTTEVLYRSTVDYLNSVIKRSDDKDIEATLNTNLLFCLFYATGRTLDTEELVCVTSRSPKYYVSASYWDRDSMLWALPAICYADRKVAYEMLQYAFGRQGRNIGTHSRYIDGTVLEPGFELDELCAPLIAVDTYARHFNCASIWEKSFIKDRIPEILEKLDSRLGPEGLYETFLQPSDDMAKGKYLTYDNLLALRVFDILIAGGHAESTEDLVAKRALLEKAISRHCIREINRERQYIWSTDGSDRYDVYDEPPGSLLLIPCFYLDYDREAYQNTVKRIEDPSYKFSFAGRKFGAIGCEHAPHPWVLSLANRIRVFHDKDSLRKLTTAPMDYRIVSESIDEDTGVSRTGDAFATAAGYVAYVLMMELEQRL